MTQNGQSLSEASIARSGKILTGILLTPRRGLRATADQGAQMPIKFVLFDAFGTLLRIPEGRHPYRQILKEGIQQGRRPQPDDLHQILTRNLDLAGAANLFGINISAQHMTDIQRDLAADLSCIQAFEDGLLAVERLQAEGIKVGIASNLAAPYGEPVRRLYPSMDAFGFSFALGAMKPHAFMYRATCELLGVDFERCGEDSVVMIGDSEKCDRDGPRAAGVRGFLLNRQGGEDFSTLTEFADMVLGSND